MYVISNLFEQSNFLKTFKYIDLDAFKNTGKPLNRQGGFLSVNFCIKRSLFQKNIATSQSLYYNPQNHHLDPLLVIYAKDSCFLLGRFPVKIDKKLSLGLK